MISRNVAIAVGILVLVALGFIFISNMTGNVIKGSASNGEIVGNEYFRISDFGKSELNNEVKYGKNNNRSE